MSDELYLSHEVLVVPTVDPRPLSLDMRKIYKARARIIELVALTRAKAGDFLATVIEAKTQARDYQALVRYEVGRWKTRLKTVRGIVVLDKAPEMLKVKGLASSRSPAGSEDLRDSVVFTDSEYIATNEKLLQADAALEYLDTRVGELTEAYFSAQAIIAGPDPVSKLNEANGHHQSAYEKAVDFARKYDIEEETTEGFGKAR